MSNQRYPDASLAYKKIPAGQFSPEMLERAKGKLQELGAKKDSRIFHVKRDVKYSEKVRESLGIYSHKVDVFFAVNQCVELELQQVTSIMAREGCEFPVYVHTDRMTSETAGGRRTYYLVFERGDTTTPSPVMLKADSYATLNYDRLAFLDLVRDLRFMSGKKQLQHFGHILKIIEQNYVDNGTPAQLVWGGRVWWTSGTECGERDADILIRKIDQHGLAGPTFIGTPGFSAKSPGIFDFHGHPPYEDRYLAPPSYVDIDNASSSIFRCSGHARVCIQAIALQEKAGSFRLFLNAYVLGEDWDYANYGPLSILTSYLNTVYNTIERRHVDRNAASLLRDMKRMVPAFNGDRELARELDQLDSLVRKGRGASLEQKKQWNLVMSKMDGLHLDAHRKEFIVPEVIWTQRLWELSGGEIDFGL